MNNYWKISSFLCNGSEFTNDRGRRAATAAAVIMLLAALGAGAVWGEVRFGKKDKGAESAASNEVVSAFQGQHVVPRVDLPRGNLVIRGGVVDFAEIERRAAIVGEGPRAGSVVRMDEVSVGSEKIRFVLREPGKKPDPRALGLIVRPAKGETPGAYRSVERLTGLFEELFEFVEPPAEPAPAYVVKRPTTPAPAPQEAPEPAETERRPPPPSFDDAAPATQEAPEPAETERRPPPPPSSDDAAPSEADEQPAGDESEGIVDGPTLATGMSKQELVEQFGEPLERDVSFEGDVVVEKWFYEFSDHSSVLVFLRDGVVERIKRF
ncbi:MAG: hypothetical protein JSV08_00330 [Acidobacteriota bacterium]|nr:MAG: hypothetical protein JSV08_00330 [Acidobacteriota bacterium]